jgi:glycosyltransferase involved in cell wall biosynthesis
MESVHLALAHRPFDTRIFHKECKTLAKAGHRVTLVVPCEKDAVVDEVSIRAVPNPPNGRALLLWTPWLVGRAARSLNPRAVFHFHDSYLILVMMLLKLSGRCVVYDVHEDTPKQMLYQHWIPRGLRRVASVTMRFLEWLGGKLFDGLIAAEPVIAERFPASKTVLVRNFPVSAELLAPGSASYASRPPHMLYAGGITQARGIEELLAAMGQIPPQFQARLVLAGTFYPAALEQDLSRRPEWRLVTFKGFLSRPEIVRELGNARAGLVTMHPTERYQTNYPVKLFEYMAAGIPVIASDFPAWRPFVVESECGILVDPLDPSAIAAAIQWILEHPAEAEAMGRRGREAIRRSYNWETEAERLLDFYARFTRERETEASPEGTAGRRG